MKAQSAPNVTSNVPLNRAHRQVESVEEILRQIRTAAAFPLERATTLPAETYTSDAFFEWEMKNILHKDWLCLAHVSQLPNPGDFITLDVVGEPLLVVHGKDGVFRALSRVCPHRAMDILPPGFEVPGQNIAEGRSGHDCAGHTRLFMCPYHAWTFELDGKLKGSPEMHLAECFDRSEIGLKSFRTELWNGFVFVNFNGAAEPVASLYAEMSEDVAAWNPEELVAVVEMAWDCEFNWKVLVENFMECYHHIGAHAKTLQPLMPARECWTEEERATYVRGHLPLKQAALDELNRAAAAGREFPIFDGLGPQKGTEWGLFIGYPSFLLFAGPNQFIWYRIDPLSADRSRLLTTILVPKSYLALPQFDACKETASKALVEFHGEDMDTCTAVQRGFYSSAFHRGRLSHLEMPVWLFYRYLAARSKGVWPTEQTSSAPSQNGRVGPIPVAAT
ncbi:MAG TPA: aromatic ring-hydroxylating dioxygenase subunit alpha [Chthoniobacteraceae bacterium]|jgi:phenylpropionate dioxygenase-like ring-hydroxylating dioxygenase large terminal subunit